MGQDGGQYREFISGGSLGGQRWESSRDFAHDCNVQQDLGLAVFWRG